jgi:dipeptidyl aminopeptidase/acylaminoacyl peptidase
MRQPLFRFLSMLVSLLAPAVFPGLAADVLAKKPLTVEDIWAVQRVSSPVVSPDGARVVYTVSTYDMEENRNNADIWVADLATGAARRLTTNKASDTSPAWSPDGRRLAFLSKRDGDSATQLYVMPVDGGEPERLTEMPLAVSGPKWFPDGTRIAFVSHVVTAAESPEATKKAVEAGEKNKVKARATESRLFRFWDRWLTDGEYPHIFALDVATKKVTDLLPGSKMYFGLLEGAGSYDISPDGAQIVFAANSTSEPYKTLNEDLFLVSASGGAVKNLTASNPADDKDPVFSPDGKTIAYGREKKADGWPDFTRLALLDLATGSTADLTERWDNSVSSWRFTKYGKSLVFLSEIRARTNVYTVPVTGGTPKEIWHGGVASGPATTPGGQVVFNFTTLNRPPELAAVKLDGSGLRNVTSVNDELMSRIDMGPVRDLTFAGAGGDTVQMYVVYPPGFDPAKKYPLVQVIHGGPVGTSADSFHFRWNAHAFAAPGYIVAMVNFHGSSSFGQKWVESILGAHPDKPFTDVMKATDFLIAQGNVDAARMAAAGGSYGGFMTDWIEGHTDRFKCLVSHAGVYDLMSQWASDTAYGRQHSYGGYPFSNMENVERWSPNRFSKNFSTPMLVLHGERDFRVPVTQGLELYSVLQIKGIPSRLVYYPDENHWVLKGQNSKHWYGEVLGWLARWLK